MVRVTKITWKPGKVPSVKTTKLPWSWKESLTEPFFHKDDALEVGDEYSNFVPLAFDTLDEAVESLLDPIEVPLATEEQKQYIDQLCAEKKKVFPPMDTLTTLEARDLTYLLLNDKEWPYGDVKVAGLPTRTEIDLIIGMCDQRGLSYPNYICKGRTITYSQFNFNTSRVKQYSKAKFKQDYNILMEIHARNETDNALFWKYGTRITDKSKRSFWKVKSKRKITLDMLRQYLLHMVGHQRMNIPTKDAVACKIAWKFYGLKEESWEEYTTTISLLENVVKRYNNSSKNEIAIILRDKYEASFKRMVEIARPGKYLSFEARVEKKWGKLDFEKARLPVMFSAGLSLHFKNCPYKEEVVKKKICAWHLACTGKKPIEKYISFQADRYYRMVRKISEFCI